jgi:ketosteroid isomerase-like protein
MSEENVELVYQASEAFNRRDVEGFLALSDPDVEFISRLMELEGGEPYRGHDGIRSWWENVLGVWSDLSSEIEEVRDLGDVTIARLRLRGHGMGSDAPIEQTTWFIIEWRNNKAIRWHTLASEADALEAAGLSE